MIEVVPEGISFSLKKEDYIKLVEDCRRSRNAKSLRECYIAENMGRIQSVAKEIGRKFGINPAKVEDLIKKAIIEIIDEATFDFDDIFKVKKLEIFVNLRDATILHRTYFNGSEESSRDAILSLDGNYYSLRRGDKVYFIKPNCNFPQTSLEVTSGDEYVDFLKNAIGSKNVLPVKTIMSVNDKLISDELILFEIFEKDGVSVALSVWANKKVHLTAEDVRNSINIYRLVSVMILVAKSKGWDYGSVTVYKGKNSGDKFVFSFPGLIFTIYPPTKRNTYRWATSRSNGMNYMEVENIVWSIVTFAFGGSEVRHVNSPTGRKNRDVLIYRPKSS